jgi:hypothetical protein
MNKSMEVTCSVGRALVKVTGENERSFDLHGGAEDARIRDVVDFANVNGCATAMVSGPESAGMVAALKGAGVKVVASEPSDDEGQGK